MRWWRAGQERGYNRHQNWGIGDCISPHKSCEHITRTILSRQKCSKLVGCLLLGYGFDIRCNTHDIICIDTKIEIAILYSDTVIQRIQLLYQVTNERRKKTGVREAPCLSPAATGTHLLLWLLTVTQLDGLLHILCIPL